jgi:hypothetical protein
MPRQDQQTAAVTSARPGGKLRANRTDTKAKDYRLTSVRLSRELIERTKILALRHRVPMAGVVEAALEEYLALHGLPHRQQRSRPR